MLSNLVGQRASFTFFGYSNNLMGNEFDGRM